jgi:hypothetical protein
MASGVGMVGLLVTITVIVLVGAVGSEDDWQCSARGFAKTLPKDHIVLTRV